MVSIAVTTVSHFTVPFHFRNRMSQSVDLNVDSYIHHLVSQDDKSFMMPYQSFIVKYFNSPSFTSKTLLLLFMEVGTGKTLTSLVCGIEGLRSKQFKRVIVLSPKSVQDEFEKNLRMYYNLSGGRDIHLIRNKIMMIPYNANNSYQQLVRVGDLEDTLFIIDEAHLFMKSIIKVSVMDTMATNRKTTKKVKSNMMRGSGHEGLGYSDEDEDETVDTYVSSGWLDVPVADWMVKYIDDMEESMHGGYVESDTDENGNDVIHDDMSVNADIDISDLDDIPSSFDHSDCPSCSPLNLTTTTQSTSHTHVTNIGNAKLIYDLIRSLKRKKVICLTGTPSSKHPFETVPMFNLAGCNFPTTFDTFTARYIDTDRYTLINRSELIRKITGLVAYVRADTASQHLRATPLNTINVEMSEPQYRQYLIDYEKELAERGFSNKRNIFGLMFGAKSSFHAKTFEDSVYWNSSLSNADGDTNRYVGSIIIDKEHCPKIIKMYDDAEAVHGTCVFYFRFVRMYGVETMMHKLKMEGYRLPKPGEDVFDMAPAKRFVLFTGSVRTSWAKIATKNIKKCK